MFDLTLRPRSILHHHWILHMFPIGGQYIWNAYRLIHIFLHIDKSGEISYFDVLPFSTCVFVKCAHHILHTRYYTTQDQPSVCIPFTTRLSHYKGLRTLCGAGWAVGEIRNCPVCAHYVEYRYIGSQNTKSSQKESFHT